MKKRVVFYIFMAIYGGANAASMCINPVGNKGTYISSASVNNNRGSWTNGTNIIGETHCSKIAIFTPETTTEQFEGYGGHCWCRITHVAASNGYSARRDGTWVYTITYFTQQTIPYPPSCTGGCANACASMYRTSPGFRRALFASPMTTE